MKYKYSGNFPIRTFIALVLIGFFTRLSYSLARNPVLPLFAMALGASPSIIGLVVGISTVTGIIFKAPAGALSDIYGRRVILLISTLIFSFIPFTYLFINNYILLIIIRFIHGFATAIYGPVAMASIIDIAGERKGQWTATFSSISTIGSVISAPLGGGLLYVLGGLNPSIEVFHFIYFIAGCIGSLSIILIFISWKFLPYRESSTSPTMSAVMEKFRRDLLAVFKDVQVLLISSMEAVQNLTVGALEAFLPYYIVSIANLSSFHAGVLWSLQLTLLIILRPLMGRFSDIYGRKPFITFGMILCASSFILYPITINFLTLCILTIIFGLGEAMVTSSTAAMVAEQSKVHGYGVSMGVFGSLWDIGHALGPIITGILLEKFNYILSFSIISSTLFIFTILFQIYVKERLNPFKS
ncbi:MAG: MFS transporter [Candidatus Methanomethylicia archaeon]